MVIPNIVKLPPKFLTITEGHADPRIQRLKIWVCEINNAYSDINKYDIKTIHLIIFTLKN